MQQIPIHSLKRVFVVVATSMATTTSLSHAQEVAYSGFVQYSTGDYIFSERTSSVYFFNGFSLSAGRLQASLTVPLILQNSPWVSYGGAGMVPSGGTQHGSVGRGSHGGGHGSGPGGGVIVLPDTTSYSEFGLGDPVARVELRLLEECDQWPCLRVVGSAKAPVADVDRGFGTGAWDVGGGLSLSRRFDRWFVFADVMLWHLGDMPELELKEAFSYGLSIGRSFGGGKLGALASLSGYTEVIEDVDPPLQVGLGFSYSLTPGRSLSGSASFGLTESVPDVAVGLGWRIAF